MSPTLLAKPTTMLGLLASRTRPIVLEILGRPTLADARANPECAGDPSRYPRAGWRAPTVRAVGHGSAPLLDAARVTIGDVTLVLVGVGGFFGAIARYVLDGFVTQQTGGTFPWGTLVINVSGSLVLGFLFAVIVERGVLPAETRAPLLTGFLGAYTTFSTLMLESWRLIEDGSVAAGVVNIAGSSALGIAAVFIGLTVGRAIA